MLTSFFSSLFGVKSRPPSTKRRSSRTRFPIAAEILEDRILLAANVRIWDGGALVTSLLVAIAWFSCARVASATHKKPVSASKPSTVRTYRYIARITDNGGVTPFKVGTKITGEFTYDLTAKNSAKDLGPKFVLCGRYESKKNRIVFECGKLRMESKGAVRVTTGPVPQITESFNIVASDLMMPKGWTIIEPLGRKDRSRSFAIVLQNVPPRGILLSADIPRALKLWQFINRKTVHLDFYHGVMFPGGIVKRRAKIEAVIEKLEVISRPSS